jgi:hypothetical protein
MRMQVHENVAGYRYEPDVKLWKSMDAMTRCPDEVREAYFARITQRLVRCLHLRVGYEHTNVSMSGYKYRFQTVQAQPKLEQRRIQAWILLAES